MSASPNGDNGAPGWRRWTAAVVVVVLLAGCAGGTGVSRPGRGGSGPINEFHVVTLPVALNLDGFPGPDGFAVKLFAVGPASPKSRAITRGTVEVRLYDGLVASDGSPLPEPLCQWTLTPADLKPFEQEAVIGTHYQLTLRWKDSPPTRDRVTVVGVFRGTDGTPVASAPSVITVSTGR